MSTASPAGSNAADAAAKSSDAASDTASGTALKKDITGPLLYLFILGDVLGAGIYALVGQIAGQVGGAVWAPLVVALVLAMLTACSYAELVTKYPRAGGAAVFAERAYGVPVLSFMVGFAMLAAGVTSAAGLSLAFAGDYLGALVDVPSVPAALVFLALVALLNLRGIKESVRSNLVMTMIEVSGLVLVIVLVALMLGAGHGDPGRALQITEGTHPATAVLGASLLAYYSFVGFETSANVAEEVRDVTRVYPRALFAALITAGVVYVLIGIAAVTAVSVPDLAASTGPLLDVVRATGIGVPSWLFSLIALIAVANGALLTMIMASRLTYGMARERLLPAPLARVLPGRRTPWAAILVTTLAAMVLTVTGGLTALAETVVLLLLFVFISTNIAVLVLRRERAAHRHFRAPTVIPWLAVASCVALLTQQALQTWARTGILLAVGLLLFGAVRWVDRRRRYSASAG